MHISSQGRERTDAVYVLFPVADRLVEMGDAPTLRDVKRKKFRQFGAGLFGEGIAPGTEWGQEVPGGIERQVAVHHRRASDRPDRGSRGPVLGLLLRLQVGVSLALSVAVVVDE